MAKKPKRQHRLSDAYSFAGCRAKAALRGVFGDPDVRIVSLDRRSKKQCAAAAGEPRKAGTTGASGRFTILPVAGSGLCWSLRCAGSHAVIAAA